MRSSKPPRSIVSVLKNQYETMLVEFGIDKTLHAMREAALDMSLPVFVNRVWTGKGYLPTKHTYQLFSELEKMCIGAGLAFEPFLVKSLLENHHGTFLDPQQAFGITNQILWKVFRINLLQFLFEHLETINSKLNPGNHLVPLKFIKSKEQCMMWSYFDINLDGSLCGCIVGIMLASVPQWFNYKMKTIFHIHSERRSIKGQLAFYRSCGLECSVDDSKFPAKTMDFKSFCLSRDIPFPDKVLCGRNPRIEIPLQDYSDPATGTLILQKGTAYNAPGILCAVTYPAKPSNKEFNLKKIEQCIAHSSGTFYKQAEARHAKLIAAIAQKITVLYDPAGGDLKYNDEFITTGKPGHILAVMVEAWCREKKAAFSNADFHSHPAIKNHKHDKSFNISIKRVLRIVEDKMPLCTVRRKTGSGKVEFNCESNVVFMVKSS